MGRGSPASETACRREHPASLRRSPRHGRPVASGLRCRVRTRSFTNAGAGRAPRETHDLLRSYAYSYRTHRTGGLQLRIQKTVCRIAASALIMGPAAALAAPAQAEKTAGCLAEDGATVEE